MFSFGTARETGRQTGRETGRQRDGPGARTGAGAEAEGRFLVDAGMLLGLIADMRAAGAAALPIGTVVHKLRVLSLNSDTAVFGWSAEDEQEEVNYVQIIFKIYLNYIQNIFKIYLIHI
jgi:hypothetical protein